MAFEVFRARTGIFSPVPKEPRKLIAESRKHADLLNKSQEQVLTSTTFNSAVIAMENHFELGQRGRVLSAGLARLRAIAEARRDRRKKSTH